MDYLAGLLFLLVLLAIGVWLALAFIAVPVLLGVADRGRSVVRVRRAVFWLGLTQVLGVAWVIIDPGSCTDFGAAPPTRALVLWRLGGHLLASIPLILPFGLLRSRPWRVAIFTSLAVVTAVNVWRILAPDWIGKLVLVVVFVLPSVAYYYLCAWLWLASANGRGGSESRSVRS